MAYISAHRAAPARSGNLFARLTQRLELQRQRAQLARLDDAALADLGLTRAEAIAESQRGFWDAPTCWLQ
jgi:uncharacterized protein YjiS (DUF1127 family)